MWQHGLMMVGAFFITVAVTAGRPLAIAQETQLKIGDGKQWQFVASQWSDTAERAIAGCRVQAYANQTERRVAQGS